MTKAKREARLARLAPMRKQLAKNRKVLDMLARVRSNGPEAIVPDDWAERLARFKADRST